MDYSALVREAWATTWRFRFLWVFGLFAGATGGTMAIGRYSVPTPPVFATESMPGQLAPWLLGRDASTWLAANMPAVLSVAIGASVVAVLLMVASVIARGGITQATVDIGHGQPSSFSSAWRAGARWFWPFLSLLVLLAVVAALVVGAIALVASWLGAVGAVLGAVLLTLGVAASIVLAYAERAIVIHQLGPIAALGYGWRLFRQHLSASLLTWVVSLGLSAAVAVAASVGIGTVGTFFGGVFVLVWAIGGFEAPLVLDTALSIGAAVGVLIAIAAIANAFFWSFWTLAYLRLDTTS